MKPRIALYAMMACVLSACGSIDIERYSNNQPAFAMEEFFNGKLTAHGIVKNRSGEVIRYFSADIDAWWEDGTGTLDEHFVFDDGEKQRRVWKLRKVGEQRYIGTAGDVVGEAEVKVAGNAVFLEYVLQIPWDDGTLDLTIDDRMYRLSENVVINESAMKKFGVRVGELTLVIEKQD